MPDRITQGALYRYHETRLVSRGNQRVAEDVEDGTFQVQGFAYHLVTHSEVVVFVGTDGADAGRLCVCSLTHFAQHFRAVYLPAPEIPVLENPVLDLTSRGPGY